MIHVDAPSITKIPEDLYVVYALVHLLTFGEDIAAIWWIRLSPLYGQNLWFLILAVLFCRSLAKKIYFFNVFAPRVYGQSLLSIMIVAVYFNKN